MSAKNKARPNPRIRKTQVEREPVKTSFKPGHKKNPNSGRPKGSKNKFPNQLKQQILWALNSVGGPEYFKSLARKQPRSFTTLIAKMLPTEVTGNAGGPLAIELVNKAQAGLSNLSDSEIEALQGILAKVGLVAQEQSLDG